MMVLLLLLFFSGVKEIRETADENELGLDDKKVICYSSNGLTSCVGWFAFEMAGIERISVYDAGIKNWMQNFEDQLSPDAVEHLQY